MCSNYICIFFRGFLYWIDWGNDNVQAHIKRAYFDGSMITTIVTFDRGIVPLGITVDISTSLLYWADSNGTIQSCNSKGRKRRIVYTNSAANIDGITIVRDYVYWIDKIEGSVWRVSKTNASDVERVVKGLTQLRGISSTDMTAISSINLHVQVLHKCLFCRCSLGGGSCLGDNNHCSHLCLVNGSKSARCECPPGLALKKYACNGKC